EVLAGYLAEVGLHVAIWVAVNGAKHRRPRLRDEEQTSLALGNRIALPVEDLGNDAGKGKGGRARFGRRGAGQWGDQDPARLRLAAGIDDRAPALPDRLAVPNPCFGIDRLTYRAQHPQAGQIVFFHVLLAQPHEGANRGGRGVEDGDLVPLDDVPEAIGTWRRRRSLVNHRGSAVH